MAYHKKERKFGRTKDIREAFFKSLARSIILHERIVTTEARARTMRPYVEKLVTIAKKNDLAARRLLLGRLHNDNRIVSKLMTTIAPRYADRQGGYTRIVKVEGKAGSGRAVAVIEFV